MADSDNLLAGYQGSHFGIPLGGAMDEKWQKYRIDRLLGFGGPKPSTEAADTRAQLARADYQDWLDTFKPIEDELIAGYDNAADRQQAISEAQTRALTSVDNAEGAFRRRTRGLGMMLTPDQEQAHSRRLNLTRGLANVNAANMTRRRLKDQDQQLLTGAAPQGSALKYAQGGR